MKKTTTTIPVCSLLECSAPSLKPWFRGWCQPHYQRWCRHGDPRAGKGTPPGVTLEHRLLSQIDRSGGPDACWPWLGTCSNGYGEISVDGRRFKVSHLVYELYCGELEDGLHVLHHCDNPPCANPKHLFSGTPADNLQDMTQKGRRYQGERHWAARLTQERADELRERYSCGGINQRQLAKEFGISQQSVSDIIRGRFWKAD